MLPVRLCEVIMPKFRMYTLRNNNVLDLYRQRDLIDLDPPYQRLSVWDIEKQRRFVDSIINGIDTPKLYFHELTNPTVKFPRYRFSVIDGKQRLLALWSFIGNGLRLPSDFSYFESDRYQAANLTYDQLLNKAPLLRARFDEFAIPVVLVQANSDELIEQLFWRLNVQVPLTAPEKRNVLGGPLPLVIRRIGLSPFFTQSVRVKNNRFQHYDLAAKFLYICHSEAFVATKKGILDDFVTSMKDARERDKEGTVGLVLDALERRTLDVLEMARAFFGTDNPLLGSMGRIVLYFQMVRLSSNAGREVPVSLNMLERFNADVTIARRKSQRMSRGSGETLSPMQEELLRFDLEKQSTNDAMALHRQYEYMRYYMSETFGVELPEA